VQTILPSYTHTNLYLHVFKHTVCEICVKTNHILQHSILIELYVFNKIAVIFVLIIFQALHHISQKHLSRVQFRWSRMLKLLSSISFSE
jgi:hypothetical protein